MHAFAHKAKGEMVIPRNDFIAEDKNEAEGAPEEIKTVLGWDVNTRKLLVSSPKHKHVPWSSQLQGFLSRKTLSLEEIQSLLGRLGNIAILIPMMGHFLNNIRQMEIQSNITGRSQMLNKRTKDDLILAQGFIDKKGI